MKKIFFAFSVFLFVFDDLYSQCATEGDNLQCVMSRGNATTSRLSMNLSGDFIDMFSNGSNPVQVNAYNTNGNGFRIIQRSNNPLSLWTNTLERMTISGDGKVGIGTASPGYKLHVAGEAAIDGGLYANGTGGNIRLKTDGTSALDGALFTGNDGTIYLTNWNNTRGLTLKPNGSSYFKGGNMGLGISEPVTPLHVTGGSLMSGSWNKTSTLQATYPVQIFNSNGSRWAGIGYDFSAAMCFWVNATSDDLSGTGRLAMVVRNNGNIGVGTDNPGEYKLAVEGTAGVRKLKVTQAPWWPDYVFDFLPAYAITSGSRICPGK